MGLGGGHSENLRSQKGIGGADQDRPDTGETAQSAGDVMVLGERAGVVLYEPEPVIIPDGPKAM